METVNMKVKGMSCTNCALSINKYLEKEGLQNVKVNFIGGDVSFDKDVNIPKEKIKRGIERLGYEVVPDEHHHDGHGHNHTHESNSKKLLGNNFQRFIFCLVFAAPLFLHMLGVHISFLMNEYVQLGLTLPVFIVGMLYFGKSGIRSLLGGVPNMDVLVSIGSIASFAYSLYGTITGRPEQFMFYETTATIITLVFMGNWLEDKSVQTTQSALKKLAVTQKTMANKIVYDESRQEQIIHIENTQLKVGDTVLIKTGEPVPMDAVITWGEASVNEALLTGESIPVEKNLNDKLIGGSTVENGALKAKITAVGEDTVLSNILKMVRDAQTEKPPVQQLADKISAVFVPVVLSIAVITFLANYFLGHHIVSASVLRSIAVLVIACPCAMGLATPAAIAVGLGRAARNGVLFKNARSLEVFNNIQQVIFDKTGTLTTGKFTITSYKFFIDEEQGKRIAYSLEKFSNHPIAKSISTSWKTANEIKWSNIDEVKGLGMQASGLNGSTYIAGSYNAARHLTNDDTHNVYIIRNNELIGWIDVADEIRSEAKNIIAMLHAKNIKTILLSGDRKDKTQAVAAKLGIDEVIAEQTPEQKSAWVAKLNDAAPTAMVGDGINDAPALAKASVGISLSDASHIAVQSAQVVLMNNGLKNLPLSLGLGKHTYITIKQNLFWAFLYNVVAIPVAAFGFLTPTFGALVMGLSDVVLAINSVRLNWKKVV
ncbi:heavy metal translocating P-type ATPase [Parafilimonas terrae]|uniref:Cu+-exporting ATPase n=1 Tax=Parafilimonas terrae TaxID=1465490 RepID=A0A1I5UYG3_9BACT|nr:cation-translocating P-type ATPase [Parafilimonas terrae]SFQ00259.1 Cu+-exporting ATPase [Parafilimonas terrae]